LSDHFYFIAYSVPFSFSSLSPEDLVLVSLLGSKKARLLTKDDTGHIKIRERIESAHEAPD
jgi:hypothetical protein